MTMAPVTEIVMISPVLPVNRAMMPTAHGATMAQTGVCRVGCSQANLAGR